MPTLPSRKKVLIVDDDFIFSRMLTRLLQRQGYDATVVCGARPALELIRGAGADLVFVDLSLGGENGWEVLRLLRQESAVPVVIMTGGDVTSDTVTDARMLGAQDALGKPFDSSRMSELLRKYLG